MKKILSAVIVLFFLSCNINVEEENKKDSATTGFDSFVQKADTTLERWGDSAKEKYKDVRDDVNDRFKDDDSTTLR
jgi:ElaB/YqjD/DUF883 family membrane-anchored ribosome-binding protein